MSAGTQAAIATLKKENVDLATIRMLVRILAKEARLNVVWNWQEHEVKQVRFKTVSG